MRWSGATGAIARCKNRSTGYGRKRRSVRAWRWTCGVKPKLKAGNKPLPHSIVHGLDKPGAFTTDSILVPFRQVERIHAELLELMPEQIVDAFVLAWHHNHLFYQSHGKKKHYHRRESEYWLNFSEGLLDDQFDELKVLVFEKLDSSVKASSLVEMVNSLIRPYLDSSKGQIT